MRYILLVFLVMCPTPSWAEWTRVKPHPIDVSELTTEIKAVVPALEGCNDEGDHVVCRRLTGDFSPQETTVMDQALTVHDPAVRKKRQAKAQQDEQEASSRIKAKLGLSDQQFQDLKDALK